MNAKITDMSAFRLKKSLTGERRVGVQDAFKVPGASHAPAQSGGEGSNHDNSQDQNWFSLDSELEFAKGNDDEATVPNFKETLLEHAQARLTWDIPNQGEPLNSQPERTNQDLAERIERLKSSINRINALMDELRGGPESRKN
jgi:hypothetical protein